MADFNKKYCFSENWFVQRIFKGLDEDLNLLYQSFLKTDLKFTSFAKLWRELKFASIFAERYVPAEAMEYTEGVLHFSKCYLFSNDIKATVFGIYFVYAVYCKQPMRGRISKLRLTRNEFQTMRTRFHLLMKEKYENAAEIFLIMLRNSAFLFVATEMEAGIEMGYRKYFVGAESQDMEPREMSDPIDRNFLDSFRDLSEIYEKKKKSVFGDCNTFETASGFMEDINKRLDEFGKRVDYVEEEAKQPDEEKDDHGSLRRKIKDMAFARGAEEASTSKTQPRKKFRKTTRKRRIKMDFTSVSSLVTENYSPSSSDAEDFDMNIFD